MIIIQSVYAHGEYRENKNDTNINILMRNY